MNIVNALLIIFILLLSVFSYVANFSSDLSRVPYKFSVANSYIRIFYKQNVIPVSLPTENCVNVVL